MTPAGAAVRIGGLAAVFFLTWLSSPATHAERALFAGGCFWCMEADFEPLPGVRDVVSGYTGGHLPDPDYQRVSAGGSGHYEAIEIRYDPDAISYAALLSHFWLSIDPLDAGGQFCDRGDSYRSAIFALDDEQRRAAEQSRADLQATLGSGAPIATAIIDASTFYPAEEYHQNYAKNNALRYRYYRWNCGRDRRLKALWGEAHTAH